VFVLSIKVRAAMAVPGNGSRQAAERKAITVFYAFGCSRTEKLLILKGIAGGPAKRSLSGFRCRRSAVWKKFMSGPACAERNKRSPAHLTGACVTGSCGMEKTVLIVDDAAPVRELLASALNKRGYRVTPVESAQAALDMLKEHYFHVMFIDLHMPDMSGVELCEKIRRTYPLSFMYAMTAYVSIFALTECRQAGFDDYFVKPVNIDHFDRAAKEAFEKISRWSSRPGTASPVVT